MPYQRCYQSLGKLGFHHCFVPQLRAQLFTYHHLQQSLLSFVLSQEALGKSAASFLISYGIVPVLQTGTRGSLPSMEDTGITYKTCADSLRSYTMVDWHVSNQAAPQSNKLITRYAEYAEYNLVSWDLCIPPAQKHVHIRAFSFPCRSWYRLRKKKQLAEPDIVYPQLNRSIKDAWRPDEHIVLAIG